MNSRRGILSLATLVAAFVILAPLSSAQDEREELKQRFEERYPVLLKLRDAGKIGEDPEGLTQVVKPEFAKEKLDPKDPESLTVAQFLEQENKDRKALYELLAKDRKETAAAVAKQNALRNYKKAAPEHLLLVKTKEGKLVWKKKKDLEKS